MKSSNKTDINFQNLPSHIGLIMDGNGRWASKKLLPRKVGHKKGMETLKKVVLDVFDLGIQCVSIYAFSTENQQRPKDEIDALCELIEEYFVTSLNIFIDNEIQIRFMGDLSYFTPKLQAILLDATKRSSHFTKKILNIGLNYGARDEIIRAVNLAVKNGVEVTKENFEKLLYTDNLPPLDLIVRTSGERRLSNFMLYQAAYSEIFFVKTLWPDFDKNKLIEILLEYDKINRRFGNV